MRRVSFAMLVLVMLMTSCAAPVAPVATQAPAPAVPATSAPTQAPPTAAPVVMEPVYIGLSGPFTGSGAQQGEFAQVGAERAVEEINAAGGVNGRPLELVIYDSKGDPQEAALVAQRYVEDKRIAAVIGHLWSSETMAAMPIYEEAGMPVLTPTASADSVTEQGWKNIIRITLRSSIQSPQQAAFLVNNFGRKKIAVFHANDDNGRSALEAAKKVAEQLGAEVVDEEPVNTNVDQDFTVQLTRAVKAGADGVFITCQYNEGSLIVAQAAQLGLTQDDKLVFASSGALLQDVVRERIDNEAASAFYIVVPDDFFSDRPVVKDFREYFMGVKNTFPNQTAAMSYDAVHIFATAMNAGATKENLVDTIKSMTFNNLIIGEDVQFNAVGDRTRIQSSVVIVQDHEFKSAGLTVDVSGLGIE